MKYPGSRPPLTDKDDNDIDTEEEKEVDRLYQLGNKRDNTLMFSDHRLLENDTPTDINFPATLYGHFGHMFTHPQKILIGCLQTMSPNDPSIRLMDIPGRRKIINNHEEGSTSIVTHSGGGVSEFISHIDDSLHFGNETDSKKNEEAQRIHIDDFQALLLNHTTAYIDATVGKERERVKLSESVRQLALRCIHNSRIKFKETTRFSMIRHAIVTRWADGNGEEAREDVEPR